MFERAYSSQFVAQKHCYYSVGNRKQLQLKFQESTDYVMSVSLGFVSVDWLWISFSG